MEVRGGALTAGTGFPSAHEFVRIRSSRAHVCDHLSLRFVNRAASGTSGIVLPAYRCFFDDGFFDLAFEAAGFGGVGAATFGAGAGGGASVLKMSSTAFH